MKLLNCKLTEPIEIVDFRVQMGYLLQCKGLTEEASQLYNTVQKNRWDEIPSHVWSTISSTCRNSSNPSDWANVPTRLQLALPWQCYHYHKVTTITKLPHYHSYHYHKVTTITKLPLSQSYHYHKVTTLSQSYLYHKVTTITKLPLSQSYHHHKVTTITKLPLSQSYHQISLRKLIEISCMTVNEYYVWPVRCRCGCSDQLIPVLEQYCPTTSWPSTRTRTSLTPNARWSRPLWTVWRPSWQHCRSKPLLSTSVSFTCILIRSVVIVCFMNIYDCRGFLELSMKNLEADKYISVPWSIWSWGGGGGV